jgi:hypothetical protein
MIAGRTTSTPYNSLDVVLLLALSLAIHKTTEAVRRTALSIRSKSPYEHQPKLRKLAKAEDTQVLKAVFEMVDKTVALTSEVAPEPPRCHMTPMRFAGHAWYCAHCSHIKPRTLG